jgi:nitroreductase
MQMDISEAILKRKSVRGYTDESVDPGILDKLITAGRWAPNAGPFQISVIRNAGLLKKINDSTHGAMMNSGNDFLVQRASLPGYQPLYGAPVLMLLSGPAAAPYSTVNAALAAENILLEATGAGLGSCFIVTPTLALNSENHRDLAAEAGIPEGHTVICGVLVGHAAAEDKFTTMERVEKGAVNFVD